MYLLIDDADLTAIRRIYDCYPVDGVTTNPTILSRCGGSPYAVLKEIRAFIGASAQLHVQAVSGKAEDIVLEARHIVNELGENTFVKVPAVPEGFKAMKQLKKDGLRFTATAVYTPMQAFLAAKCGASYAAPYINRIDNMGYNGIETARTIHDMFVNNQMDTMVLAASFKNSMQLLELCIHGIGAATAAPEVIEGLVKNEAITSAVDAFVSDFEQLAGTGADMRSCN